MENLSKKIQILINLYKAKNLSKAELLNRELINSNPKTVILYNILGLILTDQKKIDEAIDVYKKGIKIQPNYAMIYNNLGSIYRLKENYTKAEDYFKQSIRLNKNIPEPQNNLGNLYLALNKHQKAIACYKKAININPKFFIAHYNLGIIYKSVGEFGNAEKYLKEAIKLNNYFYTAHRTLSQITKYTLKDSHFISLKKLYEDSRINILHKTELAFALGKASDDIKDYDKAFKYYTEGNDLRRKQIVFSEKSQKDEFADLKKIFNKDLYKTSKKYGNLDLTPIFILGMPRSGTTLVEQILSSHPKVFGGDELNFFPTLVEKYFNNVDKGLFWKDLDKIKKKNLKKIGQEYINNLKKISGKSERVTDKLPINFKWIGLIKLLLPNSKIIHCVRNPKDTCLSIFKTYFTNNKLNFAYNLNELSLFYNLYRDLMNHWIAIWPNSIIDIKYEKIIENPEQQIRYLVKACNLKWNDNCLKFYNNIRPVKTASDTQIRKKIYKDSVGVWKNYENNLKEFFQKLPK